MVDYSRFDAIGADEEEEQEKVLPQVTRLNESSKIVIGKDGWQVAPPTNNSLDYSKWDNIHVDDSDEEENEYYEDEYFAEKEAEARAAYEKNPTRESARRTKPREVDATRDGGRSTEGSMAWTQTANEVSVRIGTDLDKAKDVKIRLFFDRDARKCVLEIFDMTLILKYDVWCENDDRPHFRLVDRDEDAIELKEIDWELERQSLVDKPRCVRLTMRKRPPARDVVVWWSRVFEPNQYITEIELDTTSLKSRLERNRNDNPRATQDVWESAHRAFLDKVAADTSPVGDADN